MTDKKQDHFIDTSARIIFSDWKILANIAVKHSTSVKDMLQANAEESSPFTILSDTQVAEALAGPFGHFFKQKMSAYARISRMQMELNISKEDVFKGKRAPHAEAKALPKKQIDKFTLADVENIQNKLDTLTNEHITQWEEQLSLWKQQLVEQLTQQDQALSDIEIKEINDPEPLSELLDRFTNLSVELPKVKKGDVTFTSYLTYKAQLAIHSSLSRKQLPHQADDIKKVLKKLKAFFDQVQKQEQALIEQQQTETDEAIRPFAFIKLSSD